MELNITVEICLLVTNINTNLPLSPWVEVVIPGRSTCIGVKQYISVNTHTSCMHACVHAYEVLEGSLGSNRVLSVVGGFSL